MTCSQPVNEDRPLALSDIGRLIKRGKKVVLTFALLGAGGAVLFALTRPVLFQAEATFRERSSYSSPMGSAGGLMNAVLAGFGSMGGDQELISLLKSRQLMMPVIENLGLQAQVVESKKLNRLSIVWNHFAFEWTRLFGNPHQLLAQNMPLLTAGQVHYTGEQAIAYRIVFENAQQFQLTTVNGESLGTGQLGRPVLMDPTFTLHQQRVGDLSGQTFTISFSSLPQTALALTAQLKIKPAEIGEKVYKITFNHTDRQVASEFVNGLMASYREFTQRENKLFSENQLKYLRERRQESLEDLTAFMMDHATTLASDLSTSGIIDTEKELAYLYAERQKNSQLLNKTVLELRRLQNPEFSEPGDYRALCATPDLPESITDKMNRISELSVQRDTLAVALQAFHHPRSEELPQLLDNQLEDLQAVRKKATQALIALMILKDPAFPSKAYAAHIPDGWLTRLLELDRRLQVATQDERLLIEQEYQLIQDSLVAYLKHQIDLAQVHEQIIQQRITHQQQANPDLQGIDLETAKTLHLNYNSQLNETEATIAENRFILAQLEIPSFEISSVASSLKDPVGQSLMARASERVLNLQDSANRSEREQARIREELTYQRAFLKAHLTQANELLALREQLLKDKVVAIQKVLLELTHQELSVCQQHLNDYMASRQSYLQVEQELIEQGQETLRQQMARLPMRWVSEQIVMQRLRLNKSLVEEVAKLVESRNISNNLETVQSGPIDLATPPILPKQLSLVLFAVLGALFGAGLGMGGVVLNGIRQGLPASPENLLLAKQCVAGCLDPVDERIDTLRRLVAHLYSEDRKVWLLMTGDGPDYSVDLAALLAKRGSKILRTSLAFDAKTDPKTAPGLLQALEGRVAQPTVVPRGDFDDIESGGQSAYRSELAGSRRFQVLLEGWVKQYDVILLVAPVRPDSGEAAELANRFTTIAVTVNGERLQDLTPLLAVPYVAFVFASR